MSPTANLLCQKESQPAGPRGPAADQHLTVVEARPGWRWLALGDLWRYRELLFFLTWRDIKVRYKQTVLGGAWAVLQPLITMAVFSLFLGRLHDMPSGGVPYPLFIFAGLLPWYFFQNAVNSCSQSIVSNQNLVTKIYFPRVLIPVSAVGVALVDFLIGFVLLVLMALGYGVVPGWGLLLAPLFAFGLGLAALGVGALLSALTVPYRDFRSILPFLIQVWMFATPVVYMQPENVVGPRGLALLPLNPAYGLIGNFRAAVLGKPEFDVYALTVSLAVGLGALVAGCVYFRRVENTFADII